MKTDEKTVKTGQTIVDVIGGHDRGRTAHALSQKLVELVTAVREHKRSGSLTIRLDLELVKDDPNRLYVIVDSTLKAPQPQPPCDFRYSDDDGNLHERDPRQMELL